MPDRDWPPSSAPRGAFSEASRVGISRHSESAASAFAMGDPIARLSGRFGFHQFGDVAIGLFCGCDATWEAMRSKMRSVENLTLPLIDAPFGDPVPSIHLRHAPLGLVVVQVRFPSVLTIDSGGDLVAGFQERIRAGYPVMEQAVQAGITFAEPGSIPQTTTATLWRFSSPDHPWQVALAKNFIALQAHSYTDRVDMTVRLTRVLEALSETVRPRLYDRVGVRYSSRITDPDLLGRLDVLVRAEVGGALCTAAGDESVRRVHLVTDSLYALPEAALRARWGVLPPGATIDASVAASDVESFFIDIDVFSTAQEPFELTEVLSRVRDFCDRQYRFFRWIATPDFLAAYGAKW